jgi:hypothetical protein
MSTIKIRNSGAIEIDKRFNEVMTQAKVWTSSEILTQISQMDLRFALRYLREAAANVEFFLDVRNEQGRGGQK